MNNFFNLSQLKQINRIKWYIVMSALCFVILINLSISIAATPSDNTTFGTNDDFPIGVVSAGGVDGLLVSNIVSSGWDFRVYASDNTPDVTICVERFSDQTHFAYGATNSGKTNLNAISLASNDGKIFDLRSVDITIDGIFGGATSGNVRLIGYRNGSPVAGAVLEQSVKIASKAGPLVNFDVSSNRAFDGIDTFRVQGNGTYTISGAIGVDNINAVNFRNDVQSAYTAVVSASTPTPIVGADDLITLTVKDSLGAVDANFDGAKNVTITGVEVAPNGSYGSFNGTALDANAAGAGQVISVTFTDGLAVANLKLNKADTQNLGFSIATVTTPATNALTLIPTSGVATTMSVTQNVTAPASNGGQFAQQPRITVKDAYGNTCTADNTTVVTAAKEDAGTWTLTGTTTATANSGVATFTNLGATNADLVNNAQLGFTAAGFTKVTSATVTLPAPSGNATATASASAPTPIVGVDDAITLTVKNSLGATDINFDGAKSVTITGVEVAPNGSYGSFNGTALDVSATGAGQVISVTFTDGVAIPNLKLNKADAQTLGFSIATVTIPATNALILTPTYGTATAMSVTQNVTAPTNNGGQFAQQPRITVKDAYGNTCTADNTTAVTVAKEDAGTWTLTGTTTATANSGVATFTNLGATNADLVNNAQLGFTAAGFTKVTSATVTLPAPAGNATAVASAGTPTPVVGVDDAITLTVKNTLGATDVNFDGAKSVTITGVEAAPNASYGSFNGTAFDANAAGAGQVISVTFSDGVAVPNLKLNKADAQTLGFSIATVTTSATNTITLTPTYGTATAMSVTQNITAPTINGGQFAQQPRITVKDAYGNTCTADNATVVTVLKEDLSTWNLTGTTTATANSGVATFTNLGATNAALVNNAQLGFTSGVMTKVTSATVTLLAPTGNVTAVAGAGTPTPVVGVDDAITLTVKNSLGAPDVNFDGAKNVTIAGVEVAPNGSYGSFNGTVLDANAAGAGQIITVTFTDGLAVSNLKLNKADAQTLDFSIATVTTPATNAITLTPTYGAATAMSVAQNVTAPTSNGGQFAQQPRITVKDAYGNTCTADNATVVTVLKEDLSTWNLTGTTTATANSGVAIFTNLGATNGNLVNNAQLGFTSGSMTKVTSSTVTLPAPAGNATAVASANTINPVVGADDSITLTVKNSLGNTDVDFDGAKNVTITGVEVAPNASYGSFNGTVLDANAAGAGQVISVTFTDGVAVPNLKLNKADAQTLSFSIATVTTPATNPLTLTPTYGAATAMSVTQNVTAPTSNGGQFAQQPRITVKDAYGNTCTTDNATVVTVVKEDVGTWTLTGTTTATANSGVATFTKLGATNAALVNNAQLGFTSGVMTKVISATVNLPATATSGGSSSGSGSSGNSGGGSNISPTVKPSSQDATIVIVNGKEQDAGKETKTTIEGRSTVTVEVKNNVIESKIDEAVKNNLTKKINVIQVPVADTKSDVAKVELTGDIVKKLEENIFDVSVKRDNVEYIIPAKELTITQVAKNLGISENNLKDIKIEVQIAKLDAATVTKYNQVANTNGAKLLLPPIQFEVVAKTIKTDGTADRVAISRFSNYVERVMELPVGVDQSKITTGIVFNSDGTYSHVPTEIFQSNGKLYAKLNSLTNSNYSVVWNPVTVKSVEKHWSKEAVNDMASRLVIFNSKTFDPNKAITRADFSEYIVRALGLYRIGSNHKNKFKDVSSKDDRTQAILIAKENGIVSGYPDGTFRPNQQITREEAMVMYQKAMKVTKLMGVDQNRYQKYADYKNVGDWATPYVKEVLSAHVFNGTTAKTISLKANLTYADAAQAIKNLLVESRLINK